MATTSNKVELAPKPARTEAGQFPKGVSGNPAGRPKGRRNEITLLKETLELQLREQIESEMPAVMQKVLELALRGDRTMLKLLVDMHMTKGLGDMKAGQEKVTINIKGPADRAVIDVTPTSPKDGEFNPREGTP